MFFFRILTFQRRMEATAISLVFDASQDQATYKGPGYHHPGSQMLKQILHSKVECLSLKFLHLKRFSQSEFLINWIVSLRSYQILFQTSDCRSHFRVWTCTRPRSLVRSWEQAELVFPKTRLRGIGLASSRSSTTMPENSTCPIRLSTFSIKE